MQICAATHNSIRKLITIIIKITIMIIINKSNKYDDQHSTPVRQSIIIIIIIINKNNKIDMLFNIVPLLFRGKKYRTVTHNKLKVIDCSHFTYNVISNIT